MIPPAGLLATTEEALGLVEYLIQERGAGALACVVGSLGEGATLANALRRETGYTPVELLSGFRAWAHLKPASSTKDSSTRVE